MRMKALQSNLFTALPAMPQGFRYVPEFLTRDEEAALVAACRTLAFREFEFHGFLGKRRVVSYGWKYDFSARELRRASDIPEFLHPARERAAGLAGLPAPAFQHALVTEYRPGASIGWHRDKDVFGEVVGISLLAPCLFRFRRRNAGAWQRALLPLEARSAYLLKGPSRDGWEHSIPAVDSLRYSITFRNFRK
jgi:alkylated DNA repair dioxygenase AlkB